MFILEYKQLYIPKTEQLKNRTCQSYRWKQYAMCRSREPLEEIISKERNPNDWRIISAPTWLDGDHKKP